MYLSLTSGPLWIQKEYKKKNVLDLHTFKSRASLDMIPKIANMDNLCICISMIGELQHAALQVQ